MLVFGGVRPRCPVPGADSWRGIVSVARAATEEEDRSSWTELLENSRLEAEPTLENRVWVLRVSSVSKAIRNSGVIAMLGKCYG